MSSAQFSEITANTPATSIFSSFHAYPFDSDSGFLAGLSQIFGHPGTPVTESEIAQKPDLVLSAKCFYYTRKFKPSVPIDPTAYKTWLTSSSQNGLHVSDDNISASLLSSATTATTTSSPENATNFSSQEQSQAQAQAPTSPSTEPPQPASTPSQTTDQQPPYPTSFAAIVDLITNNKPIPGIEEIPTTVLELGSSKQDQTTRRRKPWEKDDSSAEANTVALPDYNAENGNKEASEKSRRDEGLLRLLRPDAVPDSGLVAKD